MARINKDEYVMLKDLDDKWQWLARDGVDNCLYVYLEKPNKYNEYWKDEEMIYEQIDGELFRFIQWEDEEPYNIQALIEEYEGFESSLVKSTPWTPNPLDFESEETEVKDIEWLKREIRKELKTWYGIDEIMLLINQLDEPEITEEQAWVIIKDIYGISNEAFVRSVMRLVMEHVKDDTTIGEIREKLESEVLSQEWIDENEQMVVLMDKGHDDFGNVYSAGTMVKGVTSRKLQNLLVPNREELESKIKVLIKAYEQEDGQYSNPENAWICGFIEDLENLVEEEQKYFAKIKGHENISSDDKFWNYCLTDESLDIGDNKVHPDVSAEYVLSATKDEWANLGINEANADFVKVKERRK